MKCTQPFTSASGAFGCGQCLPCRVARRRTWTHRILLESLDHGTNCSFVTLTYADDIRSLVPEHLQLWLKRLRKRAAPRKIRFFGVGEYGDISWRPHYHVALFGLPSCLGGLRLGGECQCPSCSVVRETWGYGHVLVARLEPKSAQYIAGYTTKKMTHASDIRLNGRHPEFARMSLRPGIGADAMWNVASAMMQYSLEEKGDVPTVLLYGGRPMPLGRYLRMKLREMVGHEKKAPREALQNAANKLQLVRAYAWQNGVSVKEVFAELNEPYERTLLAKEAIRRSRNEKVQI